MLLCCCFFVNLYKLINHLLKKVGKVEGSVEYRVEGVGSFRNGGGMHE